jgi:hydroxypyruvate reductase
VADLIGLHKAAREIFLESLRRVDAHAAVRRAVRLENSHLNIVETTFSLETHTNIYAVAIGKAALPMANALSEILGEHLTEGVISGLSEQLTEGDEDIKGNAASHYHFDNRWRIFSGGHPVPNNESLAAAQAAFELLYRAQGKRALVIFLISGGGSAMIEWPRDNNTTLEELQTANRVLVSCGASITEINAVRRAISSVKGGGLAARAPDCPQVSLIISDTGRGRASDVASGPTFEPEKDLIMDAASVIERYKLAKELPSSILRAVEQNARQAHPPSHTLRKHYVLLDNDCALEAAAEAARRRGMIVRFARDITEQPIEEGCAQLLSKLFALRASQSDQSHTVCLISGGEFACPVRGQGRGGRNSESALRWAIELASQDRVPQNRFHVVALSAGTDGTDGNSPAAGAIADETTLERARLIGLDAAQFLQESNAYAFFKALGDAVVTAPTATNVRDVRVMLAG